MQRQPHALKLKSEARAHSAEGPERLGPAAAWQQQGHAGGGWTQGHHSGAGAALLQL
jgi:hypothetical protein